MSEITMHRRLRNILLGGAGGGVLLAVGGAVAMTRPAVPVKPDEVVDAPTVRKVDPVAPTVAVPVVVTPTVTAPTWNGITVTVVCPTATSDASLKAACPEYFTSSWQVAAVRDGYTSGSQKLAKVDCAMSNLDKLDAVTAESLTCRDGLNAAVYGQDGKGGGACATEIAACKTHPSPGTSPTDACLELVVTDGDPKTNLSAGCLQAVANHAYAEAAVKAK